MLKYAIVVVVIATRANVGQPASQLIETAQCEPGLKSGRFAQLSGAGRTNLLPCQRSRAPGRPGGRRRHPRAASGRGRRGGVCRGTKHGQALKHGGQAGRHILLTILQFRNNSVLATSLSSFVQATFGSTTFPWRPRFESDCRWDHNPIFDCTVTDRGEPAGEAVTAAHSEGPAAERGALCGDSHTGAEQWTVEERGMPPHHHAHENHRHFNASRHPHRL